MYNLGDTVSNSIKLIERRRYAIKRGLTAAKCGDAKQHEALDKATKVFDFMRDSLTFENAHDYGVFAFRLSALLTVPISHLVEWQELISGFRVHEKATAPTDSIKYSIHLVDRPTNSKNHKVDAWLVEKTLKILNFVQDNMQFDTGDDYILFASNMQAVLEISAIDFPMDERGKYMCYSYV